MVVRMVEEMEKRKVKKLVEMEVVMEGGKDGRPRERHGKPLGCCWLRWLLVEKKKEKK